MEYKESKHKEDFSRELFKWTYTETNLDAYANDRLEEKIVKYIKIRLDLGPPLIFALTLRHTIVYNTKSSGNEQNI
jgi:hypothetical protein